MAETRNNNRRPRLLLVGWDGATPTLLRRFVDTGQLPTVAKLIERGGFRHLRSTIPPVTACAWSSYLTGKNPGKHGLYDFVTPRVGSYKFDYTNGGYRKDRGGDLLSLLNQAGLRVGSVNVPMSYPPREIDGFMISGLDAPDEKSGIAHPAELFEQVQAEVGPYRIDNRHLGGMRDDAGRQEAIAEFNRIETLRTDTTLAMVEREPVDVLLIIYNATDQVQHHFWHLMDREHPQYPGDDSEEVRKFADAIQRVYTHCDRELARLLEAFPDADLMLMSDHGAGPTSGPRVRINNVLAGAGLLSWGKTKNSLARDLIAGVDGFLRRTLSAKQKAWLSRMLPAGRSGIEALGLPRVEWFKTIAFAYEGFTLAPCVWINRKDRFPDGIVRPGAEYERAVQRVINALCTLRDPQTGQPVIPKIHRAKDVYHGDFLSDAPDLILDWWNGRTFTMTRSHPRYSSEPKVFYPDGPAQPGQDITGIHRRDGILVTAGPNIRPISDGKPADLIDVTPTSLALLGLGVPEDMDGHVLEDTLGAAARAPRIKSAPAEAVARDEHDEIAGYSEAEQKLIAQRLSDLGYIE